MATDLGEKAALAKYINVRRRRQAALELEANRYSQLDSSKQEIRLLTICPDQESAPIRCTMSRTTLHFIPDEYDALSYTWGSPLRIREILLDEKPFSVTQNLERALRSLRLPDEPRVFWIDAICINQFDVDERSSQVAIMRHVYRNASSVFVWLGQKSDDSELAFDFIQFGIQQGEDFMNDSIGDTSYIRKWQAVRRLFAREYWNRVWIIQEIAMASSIVVECGEDTIDWPSVVKVDYVWIVQRRSKLSSYGAWFEAVEKADKGPLRAFGTPTGPQLLDSTRKEVLGKNKTRAGGDVVPTTLLDLIQSYWMSHATDPKDQVYALVGLASNREALDINIDYTLSLSWVYRDLVKAICNDTQKLDIVGFSGIADEDESSDISKSIQRSRSWLPNWSSVILPKLRLAQINRTDRYWAAGHTKAAIQFHDNCRVTIKGKRIGIIRYLGPLPSDYSSSTFTASDLIRVTADIRSYHKFAVRSLAKLAESEVAEDSDDSIRYQTWPQHLNNNLNSLWRAIICNRTIAGHFPPLEWEHQFNAVMFGASNLPENITSDPEFDLASFVRPYQETVLFTMSSRRLFLTEDGDFGVGPSDVASYQDELVVLLGCNVPMVMRRVWSLPTRHQRLTYRLPHLDFLKGWAYVQNWVEREDCREIKETAEWTL